MREQEVIAFNFKSPYVQEETKTKEFFGTEKSLNISKNGGKIQPFLREKVYVSLKRACKDLEQVVSIDRIMQEVTKNLYDLATTLEVQDAMILSAVSFIERDPAYSKVATRLLLQKLAKEVLATSTTHETYEQLYRKKFIEGMRSGVEQSVIDPRILEFDLEFLSKQLVLERDDLFEFLGLRTLYERYFLKVNGTRIELPQIFWMRIAMGLAILEEDKNFWAKKFYNLISTFHFVPSTPTLLHAASTHPQLSSCYLTTIGDDLHNIFKCLGDNAQMARWSGGIANDWTPLRATGAHIKSIKSGSQGIVPFLKIADDVTAAINRSGNRRGATVAYLEVWHYDFEDFLDLRRNTGDDRRRTHDMNTASWVPDLFMKRVNENGSWTLFSPDEVIDLHLLYGNAFEQRYMHYEQLAKEHKIELFKTMPAVDLWKKMITRLFETGHPWITFKDPCNIRSPQDHVGVVRSSNLCTEITLNTSAEETAVCNLGSVNLAVHVSANGIDEKLLSETINVAIRMLDNVIDINFYPTIEGKTSNKKHRPVGLGVMGFQDALFKQEISFSSPKAKQFSDELGELVAYYTILSSSQLAKERGAYETYKGSKWDRNIFPIDTIELLEKERGEKIELDRSEKLNWNPVRDHVKQHGMRNSNTMAIAPTATISNISGCFPCIEPIFKNLYVKANMGGEFTVVNTYLVEDLKKLNLWNAEMLDLIKYYDGNISRIESIPQRLREKYIEAFDLDQEWLVEITAVRGKWIDQSQSHNVFLRGVSGKKLDAIYKKGWRMGLKTFYYLRTLGASQIEKSTLDAKKFGFTQKRDYKTIENDVSVINTVVSSSMNQEIIQEEMLGEIKACSLLNPECESCQ